MSDSVAERIALPTVYDWQAKAIGIPIGATRGATNGSSIQSEIAETDHVIAIDVAVE